ncbi:MAG: MFS transporter, partial [Microbacterium sp.]
MNPHNPGDEPVIPPVPSPMPIATVDPEALEKESEPTGGLPKVGPKYIWLMVLAQFGVFIAFITPIAISLAVR